MAGPAKSFLPQSCTLSMEYIEFGDYISRKFGREAMEFSMESGFCFMGILLGSMCQTGLQTLPLEYGIWITMEETGMELDYRANWN
ncbi:hypothetical protein XENTR_v10000158 [Xenopus tropicalis]|nr:hypothetical protein XENTR_v10000158 [Xenopus tropicalis]